MKLILWDIDGTLMQIGFAGNELMTALGRDMFGPGFGIGDTPMAGQLDSVMFRHALANAGVRFTDQHWQNYQQAFGEVMTRKLADHADHLRIMPGARELVEHFHDAPSICQGLVTGNLKVNALAKMRAAQFDETKFGPSAFGCEREVRYELVELAIDRYHLQDGNGLTRKDVVIVGDTPLDVQAAIDAGVTCFAVATGRYSMEELADAGAQYVADNLANPAALLAILA